MDTNKPSTGHGGRPLGAINIGPVSMHGGKRGIRVYLSIEDVNWLRATSRREHRTEAAQIVTILEAVRMAGFYKAPQVKVHGQGENNDDETV